MTSPRQCPPYQGSFPQAQSKKGLQVEDADEALRLGISHASLNLDLCTLIDPHARPDSIRHTMGGAAYHFNHKYVTRLDQEIRTLTDEGVLVYLVTLAYLSGDPVINSILLHPRANAELPNFVGAINTKTSTGVLWFQAAMEFVAGRWSRPDQEFGRVVGYIIGNEVTSHWWWHNMGRVNLQAFVTDYVRTVRLAYHSVRCRASWPRIFVCTDHHWGIRYPSADPKQGFGGREFIDSFSAATRRGGDFDWGIAFHAYPENLGDPRFWLDEGAEHSESTPRITPKNLEVLTEYFGRSELLFNGRRRPIILSEQGFNTMDGPHGELIQAVAFCRAYLEAERIEGIEAFILHRQIDRPNDEGGLRLGLCDASGKHKLIYECFRSAGTKAGMSQFANIEAKYLEIAEF